MPNCNTCGNKMKMVLLSPYGDDMDFIPYQCTNINCHQRYELQECKSHITWLKKFGIALFIIILFVIFMWVQ